MKLMYGYGRAVRVGQTMTTSDSSVENLVRFGFCVETEPEAQFIQVPRRTLRTEEEIDLWIKDVKQQLMAVVGRGPIVIRTMLALL